MRPGIVTAFGLVSALLGSPLAGAESQTAEQPTSVETLQLSDNPSLRMTPLFRSVETAAAVSAEQSHPFNLTVRPAEYNFAERILNEDADPLLSGCDSATALSVALGLCDIPLLRRALDKGIDPNAALVQPIPAWLRPLFENDFIVRVLARDSGVTPLMIAVLSGQMEAACLLLEHGANAQIRTKVLHMYALDYAAENRNIPMMQLLLGRKPPSDREARRITISLSKQQAWLSSEDQVVIQTPVSTGRPGYRTRAGEYVVTQKYTAWKSTLYKVPMPNFMRLNCGQTGLHGGVVPGRPASHGCIRLPPKMAVKLYGIVQLGDLVSIVE